jgi:RNA polymerase sigma-70 factor (ECF subfamily)
MILKSDQDIIEGILNGEERWVVDFIERYQDLVYRQAFRMLGNEMDAQEASQDTFLKALKRLPGFRRDSKLSTWLFRIGYTTCLDIIKKKKREPKTIEIGASTELSIDLIASAIDQLEASEQKGIIDKAVKQLSGVDALLIDLYHMQELPVKEISDIAQMNVSAVKVRLMRARKKLGVLLLSKLPQETVLEYTSNEKYRRKVI